MSQIASAQPASSLSVASGRAEVVKSRSLCSRPSIASRTGPPTSAICSPAAANRAPSSSMTGEIRISSATSRAWTSLISRGSSDTRDNSRRGASRGAVVRPGLAGDPGRRWIARGCDAPRLATALRWRCVTLAATRAGRRASARRRRPRRGPRSARPTSDATPLAVTLTPLTPATIPASGRVTLTGRSPTSRRRTGPTSTSPCSSRPSRSPGATSWPRRPPATPTRRSATGSPTRALRPRSGTSRPGERRRSTGPGAAPTTSHHRRPGRLLGRDPRARRRTARPGPGRRRPRPHVHAAGAASGPAAHRAASPSCSRCATRARRAADGSLNGPTRWVPRSPPEGRLTRLPDFGDRSRVPVTWLVDPAVLDALRTSARATPARPSARPPADGAGDGRADGSPSTSPAPLAEPGAGPAEPPTTSEPRPCRRSGGHARCWRTFRQAPPRSPCRTATSTSPRWLASGPEPLHTGRRPRAAQDAGARPRRPAVVAPPDGYFDPRCSALSTPSTAVPARRPRPPATRRHGPPSRRARPLLLHRRARAAGGPSPDARRRRSRCGSGCSPRPRWTRPRQRRPPLVVCFPAGGTRARTGARPTSSAA